MHLYDFEPGTIISANVTAGGWHFSDQRFAVWKNYGESEFLLQHINRDDMGEDQFGRVVRVKFHKNKGKTPTILIMSPEPVGTYVANDEDFNSLEIMAEFAERGHGRSYPGTIPPTDEEILMRALTEANEAEEAETVARQHLANEAGRVAASPYANVSAIAEMLGKTRTTITKWRDAWVEKNR